MPSITSAPTISIGVRLHILLLGIVICMVVYMYLICRDVKRIEGEVSILRSALLSEDSQCLRDTPNSQCLRDTQNSQCLRDTPNSQCQRSQNPLNSQNSQNSQNPRVDFQSCKMNPNASFVFTPVFSPSHTILTPKSLDEIPRTINSINSINSINIIEEDDVESVDDISSLIISRVLRDDDEIKDIASLPNLSNLEIEVIPQQQSQKSQSLKKKRVDELKAMLVEKGLDTIGNKEELIQRLISA